MAGPYDLVLGGGTVVSHDGIGVTDVAIRDGRFAAIGDLAGAEAAERFDATGLHVLPGVIDSQVHFREPGLEHKEDLASGTAAAALGGVTALFEMPNTNPGTTNGAALADKLERAAGRARVDHAFYAGATAENVDQLAELERLPGCCGIKMFMGASTGDLLVADDPTIARVLQGGRRRIAVHAEDEPRMQARQHLAKDTAATHPVWRDAESALNATRRLIGLARAAGRRVHVLHITTAEEIAFLADHKDIATVELTPQHLSLVAPDCYEQLGNLAQMNPPIRDRRHQAGLWAGLRSGVVDVIGSDHAPHTLAEKQQPYPASPSGMPGVQTLLPLLLDHLAAGRLSLARLVDLTSAGAQRIFGIAGKGRIATGYDGDLTLVDLARRETITGGWLAAKCGWSPFEGRQVTGWPVATLIRGHWVMRDGELIGPPIGRPIRFQETLAT